MPEFKNQQPACSREGINYRLYNGPRLTHGIAAPLVWAMATILGQTAPSDQTTPLAQGSPEAAPTEMPAGLYRGSFVAWSGSPTSGNLTIRTSQSTDLFCGFDSHTYMERDHRRVSVSSLNVGEKIEILADHKPGSSTCYARTAAVIDAVSERVAAERARQAKSQLTSARTLFFTPTGDRTLSGIVIKLNSRALTLKTRQGETTLALRPDTRYLDDGVRTNPADLRVNTHVFIRAGKTIEGALEAYQIIWGEILDVP